MVSVSKPRKTEREFIMKKELSHQYHHSYSEDILVSFRPSKNGTFIAEIKEDIESPKQFSSIVQAMEEMEEGDTFELHLCTNGGSISAGSCLLHAMEKCRGHIHGIATGGVHSFGSAILLKCHSFELSEDFESIIHAGSMGYGSDFSEYKQYSEFSIKAHERFIKNTYQGFLDDLEIDSLLNGKPIILDGDEWMQRSEARNDWYKSETQKTIDAMNEQAEKESDKNYPIPVKKAPVKRKPKTTKEV